MNIAILDDDLDHLKLIKTNLTALKNVQCHFFSCGIALIEYCKTNTFNCFILDRQLPEVSGDEVLKWIRANQPPETIVIMLSSLVGPEQVVEMLNLGADDYVAKPYDVQELIARISRLLIRKSIESAPSTPPVNNFSLFGFSFDRAASIISRINTGEVIECSAREFLLVEFMFNHVGEIMDRKEIFESVWQRPALNLKSSRAIDAQMHRVRTKLNLNIENGFVLQPIYGVGYRLDVIKDVM